jgi:hypothetical protein
MREREALRLEWGVVEEGRDAERQISRGEGTDTGGGYNREDGVTRHR